MTIFFVNNQIEADTVLSQQLIDDIVAYCNAPNNIAFRRVDMASEDSIEYRNNYIVYNPNWISQPIYNLTYRCSDENICNQFMIEIENQ